MATLTIRNLDDALKRNLRVRAASANRSMEEEVRQILRAALQQVPAPATDLAARIRARFEGLGDVQLQVAVREPVRPAPNLAKAAVRPSSPVPRARPKRRA